MPRNSFTCFTFFPCVDEAGTKCTRKNKPKPDAQKVRACAFVPCPMATCALKCEVVSAINLIAVVEYFIVRWR